MQICSDLPNAFWERKQHIITLPYKKTLMKNKFWQLKIHQQLNFTNTAISTIAGQLNHVATRLDDIQTPIPNSSENYANSVSKPFFKVVGVSRKDQEDFTTAFSNTMLLN